MQFVAEFRDPARARGLIRAIEQTVELPELRRRGTVAVMEVCGGHTHTIFRYGLDALVPDCIEFVHGPGCPVCVLPMARIDECVAIAERPGVILATFGDAVRVPGSRMSLLQAKAAGCDVRIVYSPLDALDLSRRHPDRQIVFFGIGFETTTPSTALSILQAASEGLANFSVFCNHIVIPPPLAAVLDDPLSRLDGFIGPGHVAAVIGTRPFEFIPRRYGKPIVVSGFEPLDLLQSLYMVLLQLAEGRSEVENQYSRAVTYEGNPIARSAVEEVYELRDRSQWRGLGAIDRSGLRIRSKYAAFDAEARFAVGYGSTRPDREAEGCRCGDVLKGHIKPLDCPMFGMGCSPETPLGSLMVSSEGACAAYYRYRRQVPALST